MTVSRIRLPREPGMSKKKKKTKKATEEEVKKPKGYPQGKKGHGKRLRQVKINAVEDELEDVRNQVIHFGAPLAKVPLDQLFAIDVPADDGVRESAAADDSEDNDGAEQPAAEQRLSRAEARRLKWQQKTPKVLEIYDPKNLSKAPPLFKKPTVEKKYRVKQRIRAPSLFSVHEQHVDPLTLVQRDNDLWLAAERERQHKLERKCTQVDPELPIETVASMLDAEKRLLRKVNISKKPLYKPTALRPVPTIDLHSGLSYRPEESARQEIVQIAAEQEMRVQRELRNYERNKVTIPKHTHGMFVDTLSTVELEVDPDEAAEARSRALLRPPMPTKVPLRERRAQKRARVQAFHAGLDARSSRVLRQMKQLAEIESQIESKLAQNREKRITRSRALALAKVIKTKKVSECAFKEEPQAVLLDDEIPDRLGALRSTVNPFVEIQRSFERRNMTEVIGQRSQKPKKRVRTTTYEHASTKFATWDYQPPTDL